MAITLLALLAGSAILLGEWDKGRKSLKKKRKKELEKIELHDLN
ncbi:hypothetical protein [Scopulibacillus darangshiensis]|nr:hypothetical protein [Scopulibacillus darangshiensis]